MNPIRFVSEALAYTMACEPYRPIVRNICFEFQAPQIVCLLGNNGAGKSTLLKLCAGVSAPDSGTICLNQSDVHQMDPRHRSERIGWLAQNLVRCENMRAYEFMRLPFCHHSVSSALNRFGLSSCSDTEISSLSGGEWKRLQLARLWQRQHQILLLDEPDAELDPYHKRNLAKLCKEYARNFDTIVLVSSHDLFFVREIATQICVLNEGLLVWNSPASEFWNSNALGYVYGTDLFKG